MVFEINQEARVAPGQVLVKRKDLSCIQPPRNFSSLCFLVILYIISNSQFYYEYMNILYLIRAVVIIPHTERYRLKLSPIQGLKKSIFILIFELKSLQVFFSIILIIQQLSLSLSTFFPFALFPYFSLSFSFYRVIVIGLP